MTRCEAGRLGGLATVQKYGTDHMSKIGRKGAKSFWARYKLVACGINNFAIVSRETGEVKAFMYGV